MEGKKLLKTSVIIEELRMTVNSGIGLCCVVSVVCGKCVE